MSKLTILIVAPITGDNFSGLTYSVPSTAQAFNNIGSPTCILTTHPSKPYVRKEEFPVYYYKDNEDKPISINDLPYPFNNPSIIIFQSTYIPYHSRLAKEAVSRGIPYVITPRGGMTKHAQKSKFIKKKLGNFLFYNKMVKESTSIHCLTKKEEEDLKGWNESSFIVPNGVGIPKNRNKVAGKRDKFVISFIGRLDINHKGLDLLLEGCSIVKYKLEENNVKLNVYGPSVQKSKEKLKGMVSDLGLERIVTINDGVGKKEKEEIYYDTDLFVHTSRFEGHPIAVLEAMAFGLPCLITPGTNITKVVSESNSGFITPEDPNDIGNKIIEILHHKEELLAIGDKARNFVSETYRWEDVANKLLKEFNNIVYHNYNA